MPATSASRLHSDLQAASLRDDTIGADRVHTSSARVWRSRMLIVRCAASGHLVRASAATFLRTTPRNAELSEANTDRGVAGTQPSKSSPNVKAAAFSEPAISRYRMPARLGRAGPNVKESLCNGLGAR
jgi:hypothetical protein